MEPRVDRAMDITDLEWQQLRLEDLNMWQYMFVQRVGTFHLDRPIQAIIEHFPARCRYRTASNQSSGPGY